MNTLSAELSKRLVRPVQADIRREAVPSDWKPYSSGLRVYVWAAGGWLPICALVHQDLYHFPYDDVADCICFHLRMRKLPRNTLKKDA